MQIDLSKEQEEAVKKISTWYKKEKSPFITLGGFAGTGKTTLIGYIRNILKEDNDDLKIAFCAYTGKASVILKEKLLEIKALHSKDFIGTIHSLIYSPLMDSKNEQIIGWERKDEIKYDLIIIDEASMVDFSIWSDITRYDIPILAVGDHGQLPPIAGKFNLMESPEITLEKIHRQAEGNPIIKVATMAREHGFIPVQRFSNTVKKFSKSDPEVNEFLEDKLANYNKDLLVLTGYNTTRVKINKWTRQLKEYESDIPVAGDRVICLKNNYMSQVFNGMLGTIYDVDQSIDQEDRYLMDIKLDNENGLYEGMVSKSMFNNPNGFNSKETANRNLDYFDFGYALTVHKAQGSQAETVIIIEERFKQMDDDMWKRWLYTAVTRAMHNLYLIGN